MVNANDNASEDNALPMYVSYSTFMTFLDWIGEMNVMPSQIDRSLWIGKFAGGTGGQLMSGLRFLGLLEGEKPTDLLEELARGDAATRKTVLQRVLRDSYGSETVAQLPSMTPKLLEGKLNGLGTTDATRAKAFSFLVNAVRTAELPMSVGIAKRARNRPLGTSKGGSRGGGGKGKRDGVDVDPSKQVQQPHGDTRTVKLTSGGEIEVSLRVNLFDLSESDHKWVHELVQHLRSYESPSPAGEAAAGKNGEASGPLAERTTPDASEGVTREG